MKQTGIVISTNGSTAKVRVKRDAACAGCTSAGLCSSLCPNTADTEAHNTAGAKTGDTVELETASAPVLIYSILTFIMPIVSGLAGYFAAMAAGLSETLSAALLVTAALISFILLYLIVKVRGKRDLEVRIVRITDKGAEQ